MQARISLTLSLAIRPHPLSFLYTYRAFVDTFYLAVQHLLVRVNVTHGFILTSQAMSHMSYSSNSDGR